MANSPSITRRAAIVGAAASTVALAVPAVAAIKNTDELTASQRLHVLAREFYERAKEIDPTITGAWFGTDVQQPNQGKFLSVHFERGDSLAMKKSRELKRAAGLI